MKPEAPPMTQPTPTLLELLEELAAWVTVDAPPEPKSALLYSVGLRAAAQRLREAMVHHAESPTLCDPHNASLSALIWINNGPLASPPETRKVAECGECQGRGYFDDPTNFGGQGLRRIACPDCAGTGNTRDKGGGA